MLELKYSFLGFFFFGTIEMPETYKCDNAKFVIFWLHRNNLRTLSFPPLYSINGERSILRKHFEHTSCSQVTLNKMNGSVWKNSSTTRWNCLRTLSSLLNSFRVSQQKIVSTMSLQIKIGLFVDLTKRSKSFQCTKIGVKIS